MKEVVGGGEKEIEKHGGGGGRDGEGVVGFHVDDHFRALFGNGDVVGKRPEFEVLLLVANHQRNGLHRVLR